MSDRSENQTMTLTALSALADGEASSAEVAQACAAWAADSEARERWHSYQLIGDVLRSEGLAGASARTDQQFLEGFRDRLSKEPVILAPAALAAHGALSGRDAVAAPLRRRHWSGPTAVAAGFVMVLGAVVTTLNGGSLMPRPGSSTLAQAPADGGPVAGLTQGWVGQEATLAPELRAGLVADSSMVQRDSSAAPSSFTRHASEGPTARAGNLVVVRDAQLDQLLAAHREFSQSGPFAPPAGLVRSVAFEAPGF